VSVIGLILFAFQFSLLISNKWYQSFDYQIQSRYVIGEV
jgi:hypothetical protein